MYPFSKKFSISIILILFLSFFLQLRGGFCKPKGKVLVLGFDSRQLNDVQDRLLRETIMRKLYNRGYSIVPVMKIESIFWGNRIRQIRKLKCDDLVNYSNKFNSQYAFYGSIVPESGNKSIKGIKPGKIYICNIILYRKDKNKFYKITLNTTGKKSFYNYYTYLSEMIVTGLDKLITK